MRSVVAMFLMLAAGHAFAADLPDFIGLVEKNAPTIVNVQAVTSSKFPSSSQFPGSGDQQDVPEIFRRFFGPIPPGQQPRGICSNDENQPHTAGRPHGTKSRES